MSLVSPSGIQVTLIPLYLIVSHRLKKKNVDTDIDNGQKYIPSAGGGGAYTERDTADTAGCDAARYVADAAGYRGIHRDIVGLLQING